MRERCNIFIRQEQAPLAKNEFVRLLDRPRCTDSARAGRAGFDDYTSEQEGKESRFAVLNTWERGYKSSDDTRSDVKH